MVTTPTPTKLTLADIGRRKRFSREDIARKTNTDMSWISRIFSTKEPRSFGSMRLMSEIAAILGVSMDEFITFLREECGKDI